ncbi:hypothetical protein LOK49_LG11G00120 [Camellia lanceoleosa]|uniref:Uncharacterized protein n=1 Tax=Camellia lanceoleosa TaxID=1840588 RepID=A0ACC0G4D8_9ERIC|nr:hypothetical protein LOK49_LG11G00120 [Camellia lanceoleosa]
MAWEEEQVVTLNNFLMGVTELNQREDDTIGWKADSCGVYTVASMNDCIVADMGPNMEVPKLIWRNGAPPSVKFFGWLAWRGRVKSSDRLARLGILDNHNDGQCRFCGIKNETLEHVLIWYIEVFKLRLLSVALAEAAVCCIGCRLLSVALAEGPVVWFLVYCCRVLSLFPSFLEPSTEYNVFLMVGDLLLY